VLPVSASAATTVSLWHMDERSGTRMTDSAAGIHGTLSNVGLGAPGVFSPGYSFNGSSSAVTVPHNGFHNVPASTTFTVKAHVRFPDRPSGTMDIIRKGTTNSSGGYWKLEIYRTGTAHCLFDGSSGYKTIKTGPDLSDNRWHTVLCVKRATSASLVVDGVSYTSNVRIGSTTNTSPVTVGTKPGGSDWYKGVMDEVSISLG
jgi:hypothetical protein